MFAESEAARARGDYSKPADLRATLGRMHEYKREAWDVYKAELAQAEEAEEVPF